MHTISLFYCSSRSNWSRIKCHSHSIPFDHGTNTLPFLFLSDLFSDFDSGHIIILSRGGQGLSLSLFLSLSLCMCVCACTWMCGLQHGATVLRAGSWWAHAWLQAVQDSAEPAVEGEDRLPSVQSPQSGHSLWAMMTLLSYWFHWSNRHDPITARRGMFMMIVRSIVKSLLLLIVH